MKWSDLVQMWNLYHNKARSHVSQRVTKFLAHKQIQVVTAPPVQPGSGSKRFLPVPHGQKRPQGEAFSICRCCYKGFRDDFKATVKTRLRTRIPGLATPLEKVHCLEWRYFERDRSVDV